MYISFNHIIKNCKAVIKILTVNVCLLILFGCTTSKMIIVPEELKSSHLLQVVGNENSWKLDIGSYRVYNIVDINEKILLNDTWNTNAEIKSYEFILSSPYSKKYSCYVEFPFTTLEESIFRCAFTNIENEYDHGRVIDTTLYLFDKTLTIMPYYEYVGKKVNSKNNALGYLFLQSKTPVALINISNYNNESLWLNTTLEKDVQDYIVATSAGIVLKYRKWYDRETNFQDSQFGEQKLSG